MEFSIKIKSSIIKNLNSILNKNFSETNIKELLIDIREVIPEFEILRDVADFIAHPTRDKGLCHSDIDLIYSKLKFSNLFQNAEKFNIDKIQKKLFNTLLINGIDKINETGLIATTGLSKQTLQTIIKKNYKVRNDIAILENKNRINDMVKGIEYLMQYVEIKNVFGQDEFINQLKPAIINVQKYFDIQYDYINALDENSNDIMICIISLLHDAKITLFDKNIGRLKIALTPGKQEIKLGLFNEFYIGLFVKMEVEKHSHIDFTFCVIESKGKVVDYIKDYKYDNQIELKEINTNRINNKLELIT